MLLLLFVEILYNSIILKLYLSKVMELDILHSTGYLIRGVTGKLCVHACLKQATVLHGL